MNELLQAALFPINLPLTILLAGLGCYWLMVCCGIFDLDNNADAEADVDGAHGPWGSFLHFLNVGEVPLMIVLTILVLCLWVCSMMANHFFNDGSIVIGLGYLLPSFLVSVLVTRYATKPFKKVFRLLSLPDSGSRSLIGQTCVVSTREVSPIYGQAEVASEGAPLVVQVRTSDAGKLCAGETALIVSQDPKSGTYSVVKVSNDQLES